MENENLYLAYRDFENSVGEKIRALLGDGETISTDHKFPKSFLRADYFLPKGYSSKALSWPAKTAIEIKLRADYNSASAITRQYRHLIEEGEVAKLVVICKGGMPVSYLNEATEPKLKDKVDFLDFDDFVRDNASEFKGKAGTYTAKAKDPIGEAQKAFAANKYTFFLGAGVSIDAKLPGWADLLKALLKQEEGKPFQQVNEANYNAIAEAFSHSSIIEARYAFDGYMNSIKKEYKQQIMAVTKEDEEENKEENKNKNENKNEIKKEINAKFEKIVRERIRKALYQQDKYKSDLVRAIAKAIRKKAPAQVITYNYDDLLERELKYSEKYPAVYNKNVRRDKNVVPIYHVHGYISSKEDTVLMPILSEKEYHRLYSNLHHWANVVQLHALNSTTCFFIGFSMTDPSQRRLLDFARYDGLNDDNADAMAELPHFVFLRKAPLAGEAAQAVNEEHWKEMEDMMSDFGLNVIWYNKYEELPGLIRDIAGVQIKG